MQIAAKRDKFYANPQPDLQRDSGSGGTDENAQNVALFKAMIKSPAERLTQNTQDDQSPSNSEDEP
jgi:hypothetical protein